MEKATSTETSEAWRQAWRAVTAKASQRSNDTHDQVMPTLRARRQEVHDGPFQGFGSPPGKF
ncbi:MAG: hypothetical protein IIC87_06590 [Chloroflexi bacterium]|nr:hypothetical protein [Chloroflexota bacterium]